MEKQGANTTSIVLLFSAFYMLGGIQLSEALPPVPFISERLQSKDNEQTLTGSVLPWD